jgi:hypothetical protein
MTLEILVIDQCSNTKKESELPESVDPSLPLRELVNHDNVPVFKARNLYEGRQQKYISQAVDQLRKNGDATDRLFVSAGYGIVDETDLLPPYDKTFSGLSESQIRQSASELNIPEDVREWCTKKTYDIIFFALGSDYYSAINIESLLPEIADNTMVVTFNGDVEPDGTENHISIPARTKDAKEQGTIVVALKGRYLQNFATHRSNGSEINKISDIEEYCTTSPTTQSDVNEY